MCRVVDVRRAVLARNDELAKELRGEFAARGTAAVTLLSAPGSGKTALLERLLAASRKRGLRAAALTADLATEHDAVRLARTGAPVRQIHTAGLCHLECELLRAQLAGWAGRDAALLFVENVGNLVCPAAYDLGESLRVTLMSVTEGEDKPLKYPTAFGLCHAVVLTKTDLAEAAGFDERAFTENVRSVNPGVPVVRTSAVSGAGVDALLDRCAAVRGRPPAHRPAMAAAGGDGAPPAGGHGTGAAGRAAHRGTRGRRRPRTQLTGGRAEFAPARRAAGGVPADASGLFQGQPRRPTRLPPGDVRCGGGTAA